MRSLGVEKNGREGRAGEKMERKRVIKGEKDGREGSGGRRGGRNEGGVW